MSRVGLLDVNVLIALFDPDHVHHEIAHDWFRGQSLGGVGDLSSDRERISSRVE